MSPAPRKPLRSTREKSDTYLAAARLGFLQAVEDVAPHVGAELLEEVRPRFECLASHLEDTEAHSFHRTLRALRTAADRRARAEAAASSEPRTRVLERVALQVDLLDALETWATPYHLHRDGWLLDYALTHLWAVYRRGDPAPLGTVGPAVAYQYASPPGPTYEPPHETRAEFLERVDAYMEEVESDLRRSGWDEAPHRPHGGAHLRWLARFQVAGETVEGISGAARVGKRNVERALKSSADLIGLTRRTL